MIQHPPKKIGPFQGEGEMVCFISRMWLLRREWLGKWSCGCVFGTKVIFPVQRVSVFFKTKGCILKQKFTWHKKNALCLGYYSRPVLLIWFGLDHSPTPKPAHHFRPCFIAPCVSALSLLGWSGFSSLGINFSCCFLPICCCQLSMFKRDESYPNFIWVGYHKPWFKHSRKIAWQAGKSPFLMKKYIFKDQLGDFQPAIVMWSFSRGVQNVQQRKASTKKEPPQRQTELGRSPKWGRTTRLLCSAQDPSELSVVLLFHLDLNLNLNKWPLARNPLVFTSICVGLS